MANELSLSSDAQKIVDALEISGGYLVVRGDADTDIKALHKELAQAGFNVVNIKGALHVRERNKS